MSSLPRAPEVDTPSSAEPIVEPPAKSLKAEPLPPPSVPFVPHAEMPDMKESDEVDYCSHCGFPFEFCEFGPKGVWEAKCRPNVLKKHKALYPHLAHLESSDISAAAKQASDVQEKKDALKKTPKRKNQLSISKAQRKGRKMVTVIQGLADFGIDLQGAMKKANKKFACGGGVDQDSGSVEIQGDLDVEDLVEWLEDEFEDEGVEEKNIRIDQSAKRGKNKR